MSFILLGILNSQVTGAGGGSYELIESQVLTSSASSVTFSGLSSYSEYKHLQVRATMSISGTYTGTVDTWVRLNGVTTNHSRHGLLGDGSSVTSYGGTSSSRITMNDSMTGNSDNGIFGAYVFDFLDAYDTNKNTTMRALAGNYNTGARAIGLYSGAFLQTDAISSIYFQSSSGDLAAGSRFSLYGIRG